MSNWEWKTHLFFWFPSTCNEAIFSKIQKRDEPPLPNSPFLRKMTKKLTLLSEYSVLQYLLQLICTVASNSKNTCVFLKKVTEPIVYGYVSLAYLYIRTNYSRCWHNHNCGDWWQPLGWWYSFLSSLSSCEFFIPDTTLLMELRIIITHFSLLMFLKKAVFDFLF